jgi:hypothetical protein
MSGVIYTLLNPLVMLFLLLVFAHYLLPKNRKNIYRIAIALLMLFSTPYPIYKLVQTREFTFAPLDSQSLNKSEHYNIMVLGAGKNNDILLSENLRLSQEVLSRLVEGVKWCRRLPHCTLICSGPLVKDDKSQAQLLKETAVMLGLDSNNIEYIDQGFNTQTEAQQYFLKFDTTKPLIICTSALHMERSKAWFQHYGVQRVYAAPSSYRAPHEPSSLDQWIPSWSSFSMWQNYFKEVLGTWMVAST